jgi:hypothetical protein
MPPARRLLALVLEVAVFPLRHRRPRDGIAWLLGKKPEETHVCWRWGTYAAGGEAMRAGDTLSAIAQRILGDGNRWPEIHALNRDRVKDPNLILPGWELKLP